MRDRGIVDRQVMLSFTTDPYHPGDSNATRDTLTIKTWTNDQIPGGVVKAEVRTEGLSITTPLVDSTAKK